LTVILIGVAIGIGAFTLVYAKGHSYLTDSPSACANCHVMEDQYAAWMKSSHRAVAVCNDCHTPHNLIGKYATKARNGFWHSFYFTTGDFHEPIQITAFSRRIAESACRDCHQAIASSVVHGEVTPEFGDGGLVRPDDAISCTRCHIGAGHWTR
jgi:cytochrome c nitrite reductase small subunit